MTDKIFVNGLISKEVPETAPEFILGKMSIKVSELSKWLEDNKTVAENDWINLTILRSRTTGKRYIEVDAYKKEVKPLDTLPTVKVDTGEGEPQFDENGVPF